MFSSLVVKVLVFIFRQIRKQKPIFFLPQKVSRVAVVCSGGVGDILLTTPAIRSIKESHPLCRVTALVHHKRIDMLKFNPHVDEILPLKKNPFYYVRIFQRLKAEFPNAVCLFHTNDIYIYCLASLVCPDSLIGFKSHNPFSFLLGKVIEFDDSLHVIENNLKMMSLIRAQTENLAMTFSLDDDVKETADQFFNHAKYTVGFQLGSGFVGRRWPISKYAELGNRLIDRLDVHLILLVSPKEKPLADELNHDLKGQAVTAVTDLLTAGEVISRLNVLVTPDTGPMHMAIALQCPTVALSGPTNPKNFGSMNGGTTKHIKIHKTASNESYIKLSGDFTKLMNRISSDEVFNAVLSILDVESLDLKPDPKILKEKPLSI